MSRDIKNILTVIVHTVVFLLAPCYTQAQPTVKKYSFSKGSMQISLSKNLNEKELDEFIKKYDIANLALKRMIKNNFKDSIIVNGWKIEENSNELLIISKALLAADNLGSFNIAISNGNPVPLNNQKIGINKFRKQLPFVIDNGRIKFTLAGRSNATKILLAGNFTNWEAGALPMQKTAEGWTLSAKLPSGKYNYKFIVDGNWIVDPNNAVIENDGEGNNNSVFYVPNSTFKLEGYTNAKNVFVAGSFANWEDGKIRMNQTGNGWELPVFLDTGTYTYRFLVDKNWMTDPVNKNKFPNEFGEYNSVISIGKPVLFELTGLTNAKKVYLAGSFNDWRPFELAMTKTATGWQLPYVLGAGNYEYKFIADNQWLNAEGSIVKNDRPGSVFVIEPNYTFRFKNAFAKSVYLAGDFNNWSPNAYLMKREGDEWILRVNLSAGKHLYKFVVDGNWIIDPSNKLWEENEHGTGNSILWIK